MRSFFQKAANVVSGNQGLSGSTMNIGGTSVTVGDKIAEGGYGCIYRATDNYGKTYAVKVLQAPDQEHFEMIQKEFEIQKKCSQHPNVVKVFGMSTDNRTRQTTILMEFCQSECVKEMNQYFSQGFSVNKIIEIFTQVCDAVNFMHTQNPPISHRDLKVENILYNEGKYKLCDFGSATTRVYTLEDSGEINQASDDIQRNTTPLYRSPEMCDLYRRQKIDTKSDVWAIGGILFKLATFRDPFPDGSNLQILNCSYRWPNDRQVNPKIKKLVEYCFETNPAKRPTVRQVLAATYNEFPDLVDKKWQSSQSSAPQAAPEQPPQQQQQSVPEFSPYQQQAPMQIQVPQNQVSFGGCKPPSGESSPVGSQNTFNPFQKAASQEIFGGFATPAANTNPPQYLNFGTPLQQQQNASSLIDFDTTETPKAEAPAMIDLSASALSIDTSRIEKDRDNLIKEILAMDDSQLSSALYSINTVSPEFSVPFYFALVHAAGTRAPLIIQYLPVVNHPQFAALIEARKNFSSHYTQYEGNYALGAFMIANKAKPPPVGQPPICQDAVKEILSTITACVGALRVIAHHDLAEEAFCAYQVAAYCIAKLKQFKVNEGYIDAVPVPALKNLHGLLKRIFDAMPEKIPFPAEPFDFGNAEFLKKIRAPASKPQPK